MAPGARKQTTYAHKRNRAKPAPAISASSPLPDHDTNANVDEYDTNSQLSSHLKRVRRRSSNPELPLSKRLRSASSKPGPTPAASPAASPTFFETPHPSVLTEAQKFKLNSSRPSDPDQISPFPNARSMPTRTSSRNKKENAARRSGASKKTKFLDSPFNSRPGSATVSPQKMVVASPQKTSFKRTLSDTRFNPNVAAQSASMANSPAYTHSPIRARRPSAPSPPRDTFLANLDIELQHALANPFFFPTDVDFNRPPSSLSMYGDTEHFFDEAQGVSTPASEQPAYRVPPAHIDMDDDDLDEYVHPMDVDLPRGPQLKEFRRERSPWLSDSLISPPNSQEWDRPPQDRAYTQSPMHDHDVDMDDELGLGMPLGAAFNDAPAGGDLKQMFDGLAIGSRNRMFGTRTRSLDSATEPTPVEPTIENRPKGRDRRGTIRASDFIKTAPAVNAVPVPLGLARRTRSGTVVGPPMTARARSLDRDREGLGEVDEGEELGGWVAEDWAVAAPPSPVVTRTGTGNSRRRRVSVSRQIQMSMGQGMLSMDRDELDFLSGPVASGSGVSMSGLMPAPVLHAKRSAAVSSNSNSKGKGKEKADVVMEEDEDEDDELLLKPGMRWDWFVFFSLYDDR
ncbi:hypothetical protein HMN09_00347000 [Mycena chlorophos]|uniref:Uncharacterized protein n=1 Tax=Mycena chlorophos TaxID=658473 RepID=A0A8H6TJM6_MYCCL|nr:hypothetical protein HMN09_00347000 [Mycena chlorophos]